MVLLFPRKARAVLGLDISATAVKILELRARHKQIELQGFAVAPLAPQAIVDHTIKDSTAVAAAIQSAYRQMNSNTRHVAIAVPAAVVISKTVSIAAHLSAIELEAEIQLEAATAIPFALDEVCMDFSVLGMNEKDPSKMDVFLVAARKTQVNVRCDVVKSAGLTVDYVDVETFAIERAMHLILPTESPETIVLIHFDESLMIFRVIQRGSIIYTHEEILSTKTFVADNLTPLLKRAMQLFLSSQTESSIDRILLSGMYANDLCSWVLDCFSLPVTMVNPFQTMNVKMNDLQLQQVAPNLLTACGLALRGIP